MVDHLPRYLELLLLLEVEFLDLMELTLVLSEVVLAEVEEEQEPMDLEELEPVVETLMVLDKEPLEVLHRLLGLEELIQELEVEAEGRLDVVLLT